MAVQTVEQVQRLAPYLEGLEKRLLGTAFGTFDGETQTAPGLLDKPIGLPQYQVAGLDPLQQAALQYAPSLVGSYAPFVGGAAGQTYGAQAALGGGLGLLGDPTRAAGMYSDPYAFARQLQGAGAISGGLGGLGADTTGAAIGTGLESLMGAQQAFSPETISEFMSPYTEEVIDQSLQDIARAGDIQKKGIRARAVGSGAFGGSREALLESELGRNVLEQQAKTAAGLRAAGYEQAAKRAQEAFEAQQRRALSGGQALGQLGLTGQELMGRLGAQLAGLPSDYGSALERAQKSAQLMGGLGQAYGQLAGTTADIGRVQSELGRADIGMLTQLGQLGQTQQQRILEAQRQNLLQQSQEPFTRLEIGQQLLKGIPSSGLGSTFKSVTTPDTNPFLAGIGAYTALQGIKPSGSGAVAQ
jgi:hypothetical protein